MVAQIETFYRQAYEDTIRLLAQQEMSALQDTCIPVTLRGTALNLDSYSSTTTTEITARLTATPTTPETTRQRRQIAPRRWRHVEFFDPLDAIQMMEDIRPDAQFMRNVIGAFNRRKDNLILLALHGTSVDGDGSSVAFGTGQTVDVTAGVGTNSGLDVKQMIAANDVLMRDHGDLRGKRRFWALHPAHITQLMNSSNPAETSTDVVDQRFVSIDFNAERPLVNGQPLAWMGAEVRISTEFTSITDIGASGSAGDGYYACLYTDDAVTCGTAGDVEVHMDEDFTHYHALQVTHYMWINAIRIDENKVVRMECVGT